MEILTNEELDKIHSDIHTEINKLQVTYSQAYTRLLHQFNLLAKQINNLTVYSEDSDE